MNEKIIDELKELFEKGFLEFLSKNVNYFNDNGINLLSNDNDFIIEFIIRSLCDDWNELIFCL